MKRRDALKKLGLGTGIVVATPTLINFLQSCSSEATLWQPVFLTEEQGSFLKAIVDVILPKTDTPSASELNIPQFIDKYLDEVLQLEEQKNIQTAFNKLTDLIKLKYNKNVNNVTEEQHKTLLDNHMLLKEPEQKDKSISISGLLNTIKWMTINAFRTTELIGETVLAYDPVPGASYCDDLNKLTQGKSWSIQYSR